MDDLGHLEPLVLALKIFPTCTVYGVAVKDGAVFFQTESMEALLLISGAVLPHSEWNIQLLQLTEPEKALAFAVFSLDERAGATVGTVASRLAYVGTDFQAALDLRKVNQEFLREMPASQRLM